MSLAADREFCQLCGCWVQLNKEDNFRRHSDPRTQRLSFKGKQSFEYDDCPNSGRSPAEP